MVTPVLRELAEPHPPHLFDAGSFPHDPGELPLIEAWETVCERVLRDGNAEELHASREDYLAVLLAHLKILDGSLALVERFREDLAHPEDEDDLRTRRERLQQHFNHLFPRWQTLEDLEAILLDRISLPNDHLKALAAKFPPPQSWYDEANEKP